MQPNQQVDFLSDGGEDVRNVQLYLNPQAEHLLDWFHLTMRLTVLNQTAKGLPETVGEGADQYELRPGVLKDLQRIKWFLWHGNVQALNELQSLEIDSTRRPSRARTRTLKTLERRRGLTHLCRAQPGVRTELRGTLSQRGKDRFRFRRVGDQSSREQTAGEDGEETTDGVEPAWSTSSPADTNPGARRRVGEHLPALVSGFPPSKTSQESGMTHRESPALHHPRNSSGKSRKPKSVAPNPRTTTGIFSVSLR